MKNLLNTDIEILVENFQKLLYEIDEDFVTMIKTKNLKYDNIERYLFWEWPHGVGLFGIYKLWESTKDQKYMNILTTYYEKCLHIGLPEKNINTMAPLLTLALLGQEQNNTEYLSICKEWAQALIIELPKTPYGGFQHMTINSPNNGELWDDTLFMAILFLGTLGKILNNKQFQEEAEYQFLMHCYFLSDRSSGLWYHGWTFNGNNNFVEAFWGRGNCWVTAAIPEFLELAVYSPSTKRILVNILERQVKSLIKYQDKSGMWHTLINDSTSYLESSATCGFGFGILDAIHKNYLPSSYKESALQALKAMLLRVSKDGSVSDVSYGTPIGRTSLDFYKQIPLRQMPYGQILCMLFFMEAAKEY